VPEWLYDIESRPRIRLTGIVRRAETVATSESLFPKPRLGRDRYANGVAQRSPGSRSAPWVSLGVYEWVPERIRAV